MKLNAINNALREDANRSHSIADWLNEAVKRLESAQDEQERKQVVGEIEERIAKDDEQRVDLLPLLEQQERAVQEIDLVRQESSVEDAKLRAEVLKHQSTIAGAALLGIAAINRLLPGQLTLNWMLWLSCALLLWTVGASLVLMQSESLRAGYMSRTGTPDTPGNSYALVYLASMIGIPAAFTCS